METTPEYNKGLIYTAEAECADCSKCIHECPSLRANVSLRRDIITYETCVDERECIVCGTCLKTCLRNVRSYRDDCEHFFSDLRKGKEFSVLIAPSLPLNYPDEYEHILGYLKSLGVKKFYPVSFGADITVWGYVNYIREIRARGNIAQPCPTIVTHIEKHMPDLIDNIIPIQSPMMCTAIYLKKYLKISDELVFISPCIAKKLEIESKRGMGLIKYNVTFDNLLRHIKDSKINLSDYEKVNDELEYGMGSIFPISGGLKYNVDYYIGGETFVMEIEGEREAYDYLDEFEHEYINNNYDAVPALLDILNCRSGCIGGTGTDSDRVKVTSAARQAFLMKKKKNLKRDAAENGMWSHPEERVRLLNDAFKDLDIKDFMCEYEAEDRTHKKTVTEDEIEEVLSSQLLKFTDDERRTDCSGCGYRSCRAMAKAIALGINQRENCVFYVRSTLAATIEDKDRTEMTLRALIDTMPLVAIVIDDNLNVLTNNSEAMRLFEVSSADELEGLFVELSPEFQPDGSVSIEKAKQIYDEAYDEGIVRYEWMYINSRGEKIPCDLTAIRFDISGANEVICFILDKRDYYKNLENIAILEQRLKAMLDASPILCAIYDENLNITDVNEAAATLFGLSDKNVYVERLLDLCPEFQPCGTPSKEKVHKVFAEAFKEGHVELEWMHCTLDKKTMIPCYVNLERVRLIDKTVVMAFVRDMRKEKDMIKKLEEAVSREQDANDAKTRFLANMSHEIRTPISAVIGISELEVQRGMHSIETEEAFLRIYNSSNLLLTIVNDILDLAKVASGKMEIVTSIYKTAELIADTVQLNLMNTGDDKIKFSINIDKNLPEFLIGDEIRIKQILNNLLSNAKKYTDKGEVNLTISASNDTEEGKSVLCITVSDTGQGLTKKQVENLFVDEFTRFNLKVNRKIQGSGLGLSITHKLVNMMGGVIQVESEKGKGSTFTVKLPQKVGSSTFLGEEEAARLQDFDTIHTVYKSVSKVEHEPMPYGKVLVVDDVDTNLYVAKGMLMLYKLSVDTAVDGFEAIEKIENGNVYDIIFMDHMMPNMDGVEATKRLRAMGYNEPIIALTANALIGSKEMFMENGFNDFASKPVNIDQMEMFLLKYIKNKKNVKSIKV